MMKRPCCGIGLDPDCAARFDVLDEEGCAVAARVAPGPGTDVVNEDELPPDDAPVEGAVALPGTSLRQWRSLSA